MNLIRRAPIAIAMALTALLVSVPRSQTQTAVQPNDVTRKRLQPIVKGILAAWDKHDVVCLGEDHGSKNDSDLRLLLVEHPDFIRKVNVVMVEFANDAQQDLLDRFVLDGEDMPREQLRQVWMGSSGSPVWESPIYEAFLRAVRKVNLAVPRDRRIRLLAGDDFRQSNRGKVIRELVAREILDKRSKALTIYGAEHCTQRAMGFPGELAARYPNRIWSAFNFYDPEAGRQVFGLSDEPALIPIRGTDKANLPVGKMFFRGRYNDPSTLQDMANAIVYYGNIKDSKVRVQQK